MHYFIYPPKQPQKLATFIFILQMEKLKIKEAK